MKTFGYGLIGSGFMGKCHAYAMRNAPRVFALPLEPRFEGIADVDAPSAERAAGSLGFPDRPETGEAWCFRSCD